MAEDHLAAVALHVLRLVLRGDRDKLPVKVLIAEYKRARDLYCVISWFFIFNLLNHFKTLSSGLLYANLTKNSICDIWVIKRGVGFMRIIICEDETVYACALTNSIMRWKNNLHIKSLELETFHSAEDLLEKLHQKILCDIMFLDIKMPEGLSGYDLAKKIRTINQQVTIVFVTNSQDFAIQGYQLNIFRYITKPFCDQQIFEVLDITHKQLQLSEGHNVVVTTKGQQIVIPHHEILYIESHEHNLKIYTTSRTEFIQIRLKIGEMMTLLNSDLFTQTHRGFIANVMYIRKLRRKHLYLADNTMIPIGEKYLEKVRSSFSKYYLGREY